MPEWSDGAAIRKISGQLTAILERGYLTSPDPESGAMDLAALRGGVEALGEQDAAELLSRIADDPRLSRLITSE